MCGAPIIPRGCSRWIGRYICRHWGSVGPRCWGVCLRRWLRLIHSRLLPKGQHVVYCLLAPGVASGKKGSGRTVPRKALDGKERQGSMRFTLHSMRFTLHSMWFNFRTWLLTMSASCRNRFSSTTCCCCCCCAGLGGFGGWATAAAAGATVAVAGEASGGLVRITSCILAIMASGASPRQRRDSWMVLWNLPSADHRGGQTWGRERELWDMSRSLKGRKHLHALDTANICKDIPGHYKTERPLAYPGRASPHSSMPRPASAGPCYRRRQACSSSAHSGH